MMEQNCFGCERRRAGFNEEKGLLPGNRAGGFFMKDASSCTFEIGAVLNGKWVILEFIGKGGMGEVYTAPQERETVLKLRKREVSQQGEKKR